MRKIFLVALNILAIWGVHAQNLENAYYFDFGPNDATNGNETVNPDANGNYWNNFTNPLVTGESVSLINNLNESTGATWMVTSNMEKNGILNGGLLSSSSDLLGDFAINTATQDYFFVGNATGGFEMAGLDPTKGYVFKMFGSRVTTETRITAFKIMGSDTNTYTHQTSGTALGGASYNGNNSTILVTDTIFPTGTGKIRIELTNLTSIYGYLNVMKMEEFSNTSNSFVRVESIDIQGGDITEKGGVSQLSLSFLPVDASEKSVIWSISDNSMASISQSGLLTAYNNGTVTITATTCEAGSTVSGSKTISISGQYGEILKNTFYFDFGPNDATNGNVTVNPDANGNYWNNFTNPLVTGESVALINKTNETTDLTWLLTSNMEKNGILNGGLLSSSADLLGDFAVNTATQDYFFVGNATGRFELGGLDPTAGYVFKMFGSRASDETRITAFNIMGADTNTYTHQTSGTGLGGSDYNGNNSTILVTDTIFPAGTGIIAIEISNKTSIYGYLNVMKMEEFANTSNSFVRVESIEIHGEDITEAGATSQLSLSILPANASEQGVTWSISDNSIASISQTGLLTAYGNGSVVVTATTQEAGSTISGTTTINVSGQVAQLVKTFYLDFGPDDATNGNKTTSPDANGNYWNNLTDPLVSGDAVKLVTNMNIASNIEWSMTGDMEKNGILNGGLLSPSADLLGEFAINTATQDFFFTASTGSFQFTGLDQNSKYVFSLFGSRTSTENRVGEFTFSGTNKYTYKQQHSGTDLGGEGYDGNVKDILVTDSIIPDGNGSITLSVDIAEGSFAYINLMKIVGTASATNRVSTLLNPGFELGSLEYWNSSNPLAVTLIDTMARTGDFSMAMNQVSGTISQTLNELIDTVYYFTGRYYIPSSNPLVNNETANLDLVCYDIEFNTLDSVSSNTIIASQIQDSWLTVWVKLQIPQGAAYLKPVVRFQNPDQDEKGMILFDDFELATYLDPSICESVDTLKIVYMGSSVALGYGSDNNYGYLTMYSEILADRYSAGEGYEWNTDNISIGGNSTVDILNRWEADLLPQCGKYVIYGLSLGNEGITTGGEAIFNQFRDNLWQLIVQARANGMEPVIANCYTRGNYNETDYAYVKQMNLLIHQWDVPSINVLGAVDNGSGNWATGYWYDEAHPNRAGHRQMSYTIVPSLFDALAQNKKQPEKMEGTSIKMVNDTVIDQLVYTPEGTINPFTSIVNVKTTGTGTISVITMSRDSSFLTINESGKLDYISPNGEILGSTLLNNGEWHTISLTHYYALGRTVLYVDSTLQGSLDEKIIANSIELNSTEAPATIEYANWFIYRSGMTAYEIEAINGGAMLKSSLEIYAPLDGTVRDSITNYAQSLNTLSVVEFSKGGNTGINQVKHCSAVKLYPNPTENIITIEFELSSSEFTEINILDISGRKLKNLVSGHYAEGTNSVTKNLKELGLTSGMYLVQLVQNGETVVSKIVIK